MTYTPNLNFNGFDTFTYTATDPEGGVSDPATVTIAVNPVNDAPVAKDDSYSTDEDTPLTVNATLGVLANDSDVDTGETLTAIKVSGPTHGGLTFNTDGSFIYTPNQYFSGTDTFTYMIFDGSLYSNEATATITVNEVNKAPVLADPGDRAVNEGEVLGFTLSATDPDLPANTLAYSISGGSVAGMSLDPSTGAFSWIPTEAQGPGSYTIIFRVTDSGTPPLSNEKTITITVNEVNSAPTLAAIGNKTVDELTLLSFTAVGSDNDIPVQTLTYSLANGTTNCGSVTSCTVPSGASINSSSGAFTWTPTEAQGPGTYRFKVVVTDNGSPNLSASEEITVTVNEVNAALTLSVNPASVIGGVSSTGKVILAIPAPAGGAVVTLSSSDTNIAAVPASVNVSAGTTSKTFSVTTKAVAASTPVTISATYKGSTANAVLTVNPAMLTSFSVSPSTVLGGNTSKGTVALNGKAPASGALVTLTSANAAATVPANVLIPAGSTSATFTINTTPVTATQGPFNISAFYQGVTRKARLTVQVATLSKLVVSPASVIGGVVSMGTVTLNGKAPAGGAAVSLSSANAAATVPASLTIPASSTSATFSITTTSVAADRGPFKISATYNGVTASDTLKVMAADLSTLTLNPTSVIGGNPVMGTVTLNGAAPTAGRVVKLKSYNTAVATVPAE